MIIKPSDLKIEPLELNNTDRNKQGILCILTFEMGGRIDYISSTRRHFTLKITVNMKSKNDGKTLIESTFTRFFDIQLHEDENAEYYYINFWDEISETVSQVRAYIYNNTPSQIKEISWPLFDGIEVDTKARSLYDELIKQSV